MIPTTKEIAYQISLLQSLYPEDSISKLAAKLMFSPVLVINALDWGEQAGLFSRVKDEDGKITDYITPGDVPAAKDFDRYQLGIENGRIQEEILQSVRLANKDKMDVEEETLKMWCRGIRPTEVEFSLHVLVESGALAKYKLKDPKDKKSEYTFYTLSDNQAHKWGSKQFEEKS